MAKINKVKGKFIVRYESESEKSPEYLLLSMKEIKKFRELFSGDSKEHDLGGEYPMGANEILDKAERLEVDSIGTVSSGGDFWGWWEENEKKEE